jgi:hypothetical protein
MDIKTGPEREARRRKLSLDAVLDLAAEEWRKKSASEPDGEDEQRRLREAASKCLGSIAGGDPPRSENATRAVRERLRSRYGR